jgi:hypothetical protein
LAAQVAGGVQFPQSSTPPQPSAASPHCAPTLAHVFGVQPHAFASPAPPHVSGARQTPQLSVPPHPSGIEPQFFPWAVHVVGVQPH